MNWHLALLLTALLPPLPSRSAAETLHVTPEGGSPPKGPLFAPALHSSQSDGGSSAPFCGHPSPTTITGTVSRVIDGDTVVINASIKVRLADIDAPEMKQPHGPAARTYLLELIQDKQVRLEYTKPDRYGRLLATLWVGERNINETLVRTGHAWRYKYARKTGPIAKAEQAARANRAGLWQQPTSIAPWEYRKSRRKTPRKS